MSFDQDISLRKSFTLEQLDSTLDEGMRNTSTKSDVLAPYNTTFDSRDLSSIPGGVPNTEVYRRLDCPIDFKGRVKHLNWEYEKNNNGNLDNGVYNIDSEGEEEKKEIDEESDLSSFDNDII